MTSKWQPGQRVAVLNLKKEGVIVEAISKKRYRVAIGSINIVCEEHQLGPASPKGKDPNEVTQYHRSLAIGRRDAIPKELDLHGFTADDARRAVESLVDRAVMAGTHELRVVHGLGSGRVQNAIHEFLSTCGAVRHFKISEWNAGITVIYL